MLLFLLIPVAAAGQTTAAQAAADPARSEATVGVPDGIEIIENEAGFYYTIKKGDTLWDLSQRFSDSPWQWPDLWKENQQIANPHWIYPGNRIRLFRKKDMQRMLTEIEDQGPAEAQEPPMYIYTSIDSVGFIRRVPVESLGSIIEVRDRKKLIAQNDTVYIHKKNGTQLVTGQPYTVYRTYQPLRDPETYKDIGIQHYFLGVVEIEGEGQGYYTGRIVTAYRDIKIGDLVMPFAKRSPFIALTDGKVGLEGRLLISEDHTKIIGEAHTGFIDKGKADGVEVGQVYSVYYQERERKNPETKELITFPRIDIGNLLVVHTEETTATVLVIRSERALMSWDRLHATRLGLSSQ